MFGKGFPLYSTNHKKLLYKRPVQKHGAHD